MIYHKTNFSGNIINWFLYASVLLLILVPCSVSFADLNENCTVSVLNRTANVKADGTWTIPNVPSNMGKVRVRATCVENGITRSGQSDWVTILTNNGINIGDIPMEELISPPSSVKISSATPIFTSIGSTSQLTVTATYPDQSTKDITNGSTGTVYRSTNTAIATVSQNGLVTATGRGNVIISASNDMVLSSIMFTIIPMDILTSDNDNDGLPDDWEILNGMNPDDPIDAQEDFDSDGLKNIDEYNNGTGLHVADTDGDGIQDGEEVFTGEDGYITNPLLADSDGDGIRDGLEVQTGSDPNNAGSYNLAQALSAIEITPSNFVLVYNTIIGDSTRQLTVTGILTDGTSIDLTSTSRGTNYNSSDLIIANFGITDGLVYAGQDGVAVITATNNGFSAFATATVRTFSPKARSYVAIPGYANNVDVSGNYAYVAAGSAGLQVVDISNLNSPWIIGARDTSGTAIDVRIVGNLAYIADGNSGLQIMDISNPSSPVIIGSLDTTGIAQDIVISGTMAFIADGASGLQIIDVSNPIAPALTGSVDTPGTAKGVAVSGNTALIADGPALKVIDISNPASPLIVGTINIPGDTKDVVARDNHAYIAAYTGGLQIVDFTNPAFPTLVGSIPSSFVPRDVELWGQFAFFAEQLFPNVIAIADVADPANPIFRAILDLSGLGDYAGTGIAVTNNYAYVTEESYVVGIDYGFTGNTRLFIGQYTDLTDDGTSPPIVNITSPADGAEVIEGSTLPIIVSATDDIAVGSVNFLADGEVVSSDYSPPYQFNYQVPVGITSLAIGATAIDLNNNIGTAQNVFVTVIPSPPPVVSITNPASGATVIEGSIINIAADATDDTAVASVNFLVNGAVIATDTTAPYQIPYLVPVGITSLTIGATATDNIGQVETATDVVVNVISSPPPVVSITNPVSGATVIEGSIITIAADATDDTAVASVNFLVNGVVVASDTTAPYQVPYLVPSEITSFTIGATVTDNLGQVGTAVDVIINVLPSPPPVVSITNPASGATVIEGSVINIAADATDDTEVVSVNFLANGVVIATDTIAPYQIPYLVPVGITSLTIGAVATDNLGKIGTSADVVVNVIPDPLTTVIGRVVDNSGQPVEGAVVSTLSMSAVTGSDGRFSITGVPTVMGNIVVNASAVIIEETLTGISSTVTPVHGGITDVGDITIRKGILAIAAGSDHSLAIKSDGSVWAWGYNGNGQLGDGTDTDRYTPVQVSGLSGVVAVAAGSNHSLAVKDDGSVWAWGNNYYGQLGDGTWIDRDAPVQVSGLSGVVAVAAGSYHSLAVKDDGSVWAWGYNGDGQLGDGTWIDRDAPVQVSGLSGVVAVAARSYHSLAVKDDGSVWAWGNNYWGQLGDGTTTMRNTPVQAAGLSSVVAVATGRYHSLALKDDGSVWAWGNNLYGQLGDGTTANSMTPVQAAGLSGVVAVAAGYSHSLAVKDDGSVWAWGNNGYGQLGDGTTTMRNTPVQVSGLSGAAAIAAGYSHSLAVIGDGSVWAWGANDEGGQLGDGTTINRYTPVAVVQFVQIGTLSGVVAVAAGSYHSLAVKDDGSVWAWGDNGSGQLGDGTWIDRDAPVQVSGLSGVAAIAAGDYHSLAVKDDGSVWAWGYNGYGQLGDGTWNHRYAPVQVSGLSGVVAVAAGYSHSLAVKDDGSVWAWGYNGYGQLGDGTTIARSAPVQVIGLLSNVVAVAAGHSHSLAIKDDGSVWAWGQNRYGGLGDGTTANRYTPVQVNNLSGVAAIAAGDFYSLALKGDGSVWGWGDNGYGQLGDGTTANRYTPVQAAGLSGVAAIGAGSYHSLAVKNDGSVWAWGYNGDGQLGDGTTTDSYTPVQASGLSGVSAVAAGSYHSLAVNGDGSVWAWGTNWSGQLGDGTTIDSYTPLQVLLFGFIPFR